MYSIYILKYNNYYNRKVKKEDTLQDYLPFVNSVDSVRLGISEVNFKKNDGITTSLIINWNKQNVGDYLIATLDNTNIDSRWFIIEARLLRGNQYELTLKRDVLVDYYNEVINADCYVKRAICNNDDVSIYNDEPLQLNQVKKEQYELYDRTQCPWIVGYTSKSSLTINTSNPNLDYDITIDKTIAQFKNEFEGITILKSAGVNTYFQNNNNEKLYYNYNTSSVKSGDPPSAASYLYSPFITLKAGDTQDNTLDFNEYYEKLAHDLDYEFMDINEFVSLYNNKIVKDSANKLYNVTITTVSSTSKKILETGTQAYTYQNNCRPAGLPSASSIKPFVATIHTSNITKITYTEVPNSNFTGTIVLNNMSDAPFKMFCMPYPKNGAQIFCKDKNGNEIATNFLINENVAFSLSSGINLEETEANFLYDIQIVPYCPLPENYIKNRELEVIIDAPSAITNEIKSGNTVVGIIYSCSFSSFSSHLSFNLPLEFIDKKIDSLKTTRIVSPNYNSAFELSLVKNNGLDGLYVHCTYMPFNPFIYIEPIFNELYGGDFDDNRGLICNDNFSITQMSSAFNQFLQSNKNYNNMFNREIQSMDVQHKYQMLQSGINALTGSISGAVGGAMTGTALGGVPGAVIGGVAGGVASLAGGIADQFIQRDLYREQKDLKQDMFSMQIDNIKAQPLTISKMTAFNEASHFVPFIEIYDVLNDDEKQIFIDFIEWNSMTVGKMGKLISYIGNKWRNSKGYIEARLIRIDIDEDYHLTSEIDKELQLGRYFE